MQDWDIETRSVFIGENKRSAEGIAMIAISARIAMNRLAKWLRRAVRCRYSLNTIHEFAEQAATPLHFSLPVEKSFFISCFQLFKDENWV
jgi:hypothetical protein